MNSSALSWLLFNFLSIIALSFYSMMEMACVSFNKVRLQYYVSRGIKQAIWLNYLLLHPSRLFGTTLIGVNLALVIGSECSREFHQTIGLSPELAPFSQVILIVIFGELAPMFAARKFPEHVAMLGAFLLYASAKLMTPFLWLLLGVSSLCDYFFGGKKTDEKIFLNQEELFKILEEKDEDKPSGSESEEFNAVATNIIALHKKNAKQIMSPIHSVPMISSTVTILHASHLLKKTKVSYLPVYHQKKNNIIGIVFPRNLIRASDQKRARDFISAPWFITENTKVEQILKQFRHNNARVAIVINTQGHAVGILNLDDIVEEIFGNVLHKVKKNERELFIARTFPGDLNVGKFNKQYNVTLDLREALSLSELILEILGHHPEVGESIYLEPFEITVEEVSLLEIKSIFISTHLK